MSGTLKVGVIGVGHIGKDHARLYAGHKQVELVGVLDTNRELARKVCGQYGGTVFESMDALLAGVDAVSVATPTPTHHPLAMRLLAGGKHVLIEKPITDNVEQAQELVTLAREQGVVLQVGHIERFNPAFAALEALLTRPRFIEAHRLSPYPGRSTEIGVVLDLMIHDIEIILHLVKAPIQQIDAVGVPVLSTSEDIANARIRFTNGCVANLTTSRISPDKLRKIRVFQDDTYLSLDYKEQAGEIYRKQGDRITREKIPVERDEPLKLELDAFVQCVIARQRPVVGGLEATSALQVAMHITRLISQPVDPAAAVPLVLS